MNICKTFLATTLIFALLACRPQQKSSIRIGCLAPLTGESANYGRSTRDGVEFAVSEINNAHYLLQPLEVIFEDDRMDPTEGVNALTKLINIDRVPVVIGPFGSSVVLACASMAERNHTILISASATADKIKDAGDYVFRIVPPNSKQGRDIADFCIKKLNVRRAAIILQNNDYGTTLRDAFAKQFREKGGVIATEETVQDGTSDMRSQLTNIKAVKPDIVFFPEHYKEAALTLKQARQLGLSNTRFISADGAMTEDLLKIAGSAAEGTYYSTLALGYGTSDDLIESFTRRYKSAHDGQDPDVYTAYYYEVTNLVASALKNVGYDANKVRDYLYTIKDNKAYRGVTGFTSFDPLGEVNKPFYMYEVRNGKFLLSPLARQ